MHLAVIVEAARFAKPRAGIFVFIEIQQFKVKYFSLMILTKQGDGDILTQIMPFIKLHRHERRHISKMLSWVFIIVTNKSNSRTSRFVKQSSY